MTGILEEINTKLDTLLELANGGKASKGKATKAADPDDDDDDDGGDNGNGSEAATATRKRTRTRTPSKSKAKALDADAVKEKLKAVLDTKGRKTALALLEKFDAEKVGDLEEDQYEKFVKACDKALGADDDSDDDDLDL